MITIKSYLKTIYSTLNLTRKKRVMNKSIRVKKIDKPQVLLEKNDFTRNAITVNVVWDYPYNSFIKADNPQTQGYLNSLTPFFFSQNQYLIQKMDNIQVNINAEEVSLPLGIEIILDQFSRTNEPIL